MTNKKLTKIFFIITLQLIFVSCKKDNTSIKSLPKVEEVAEKQIEFSIKFPDTLYVGEKKMDLFYSKAP